MATTNATVRFICDTEAVILAKGAEEALTGRLAYATDTKTLYIGNGTKFVEATMTSDIRSDIISLEEELTDCALKADVYDKAAIDNKVAVLQSLIGMTYTKTESDALLANKADKADTYTKTETDNKLKGKTDLYFSEANNILRNDNMPLWKHKYYTFGDLSSENRRGYMKLFTLPYIAAYADFKVNIKVDTSFANNGLNAEADIVFRRGGTSGIATTFSNTFTLIKAADAWFGSTSPGIILYKSSTDYKIDVYLIDDGQYLRGTVDVSWMNANDNTAGGGSSYEPDFSDTKCGQYVTTDPAPYATSQYISLVNYKATTVSQTSSSKANVTCDAYRIPGSNLYSLYLTATMTQASSGNVAVLNIRPVQFFETGAATAGGKVCGMSIDASGNVAIHGSNLAVGDQYRCCMTIPCKTFA